MRGQAQEKCVKNVRAMGENNLRSSNNFIRSGTVLKVSYVQWYICVSALHAH